MSSFFSDKNRRIIPRWRESRATIQSGEVDLPTSKRPRSRPERKSLEEKLGEWERNQSVATAADVVAAAVTSGNILAAREPADFLLRSTSSATPAVKRVAQRVLGTDKQLQDTQAISSEPGISDAADKQDFRRTIHRLRGELQESPRNVLTWVDLARAYTILGQPMPAVRAMEIALRLTPNNRFVLRSATRLFIHIGEPDRAHQLLRNTDVVTRDPWLLAAEISAASLAERTSRLIRRGRNILTAGDLPATEFTELASSIGTMDLTAGDLRAARRLFGLSLQEPTENAVAQAEWASRHSNVVHVAVELAEARKAYEAQAWKGYLAGQWGDALVFCRQWLMEEPFSSWPAQMGSYLAVVGLDDFRAAETFVRQGLLANPGDPMLINNLVVALADQGRLDDAEKEFRKITRPDEPELGAAITATEGLLAFRRGSYEVGRSFYMAALDRLPKGSPRRALAAHYLAREEVIAGTGGAPSALELAREERKGSVLPEFDRLEQMLARLQTSKAKEG